MKKVICFILLFSIIVSAFPVKAANSYMHIEPYPYSNHVLGEDLVIYVDTDFKGYITLGLYYPYESSRNGISKYLLAVTAKELRAGYVIKTDFKSDSWPEGKWRIKIQNGNVYDEIYINMSETAQYDQVLKVAEYEYSTLTSLTSYFTRGVQFKNNVLSFALEDGTEVKIFSWDNFAPTSKGNSRIYIAFYNDGYLTKMQTYEGELLSYGNHISLKIGDTKTVKLFYWSENLSPV